MTVDQARFYHRSPNKRVGGFNSGRYRLRSEWQHLKVVWVQTSPLRRVRRFARAGTGWLQRVSKQLSYDSQLHLLALMLYVQAGTRELSDPPYPKPN